MIDTVKIYTMIDKKTYDAIYNKSIVKTSYNKKDGEIFYEIVNDYLEGSYSSHLMVRIGCGVKYKFVDMYFLELEGSYHKLVKGYNSHNGFYNIVDIAINLISLVSNAYDVKLPSLQHWFLQRVDIAICYDLKSNDLVCDYINSLGLCSYPRRSPKYYKDESLYLSGTSTTLKIYNKKVEFIAHDYRKLSKNGFDIENYLQKINGFIRFECEIKSKKLKSIYKCNYLRVRNVIYNDLYEVWRCEFMKLLNMLDSEYTKINDKKDVERRLKFLYPNKKNINLPSRLANSLYSFYLSIMCDGVDAVKKRTNKATFYRNVKLLKQANIDFSQNMDIDFNEVVYKFNPFECEEVI